uniref:Uncharacterized protein n=1 Tax=Sphaerodactylus townsendi TaxID=933632 RepID=A0ACB8G0I6_9SAUR
MVKRKSADGPEQESGRGVPLPIQTFLWRQTRFLSLSLPVPGPLGGLTQHLELGWSYAAPRTLALRGIPKAWWGALAVSLEV